MTIDIHFQANSHPIIISFNISSQVPSGYSQFHMDTRASKSSAVVGLPDVHMAPLSNDTITDSPLARSGATLKNGRFKPRERGLLESSEVRRKSTVAQLCTCHRVKIQSMLTRPLRFSRLLLPTIRLYQRSQRASGKIR